MTYVVSNLGRQMIPDMTFCKNISVPLILIVILYDQHRLASLLHLPLFMYHQCHRPRLEFVDLTYEDLMALLYVLLKQTLRYVDGYLMAQVKKNTDSTVHLSPGTKISYARPCDSNITVF